MSKPLAPDRVGVMKVAAAPPKHQSWQGNSRGQQSVNVGGGCTLRRPASPRQEALAKMASAREVSAGRLWWGCAIRLSAACWPSCRTVMVCPSGSVCSVGVPSCGKYRFPLSVSAITKHDAQERIASASSLPAPHHITICRVGKCAWGGA